MGAEVWAAAQTQLAAKRRPHARPWRPTLEAELLGAKSTQDQLAEERRDLLAALPRETITHELSLEERRCPETAGFCALTVDPSQGLFLAAGNTDPLGELALLVTGIPNDPSLVG